MKLTQKSLNRTLRDSLGKGLTKEMSAYWQTEMHEHPTRTSESLDTMNEPTLIEWATDADGRYVDNQVAALGVKYR